MPTYDLDISVAQESGHGLTGSFAQGPLGLPSEFWLGLSSHLRLRGLWVVGRIQFFEVCRTEALSS